MSFKLSFASCSLDFKLEFVYMGNWEKKDLVEPRGPTAPGNFAQAKSSPARNQTSAGEGKNHAAAASCCCC